MSRAGSLHQFLMDLHSRFGSISGFWWGQTYVVSIASPELMTQHNNVFDRPPLLFKTFEVLIGPKCIDYANGSDGRERRRTYDPAFAHDKIDRYMCYFEECAQTLENKWLSYGKEDHIPLSEDCLVYAIHCAILSILGDFFKEEKTFNQFKENYMLVWNHMEYSLASPFAAQDDESKKRFDKVITWAMYFLATHKDVQDKLYKEVKSVIGEKGAVDKDNFSEFVYLIQVIDETMRCSVLASMAARFQDFDTPVIHALGVQLQDEKLWPLPNKFDPDRFSPENKKELPNTSFVPFGFAGKRKCPGYRFAYWDAGVFLATVIRRDGNFGEMSRAGSLHQFLMYLHSRFGSISGFWWGQTYVVSIASPELMTQHNNVFDRPPLLFKNFEALIGSKCIQYANGSDGHGRRRTYDPSFAHNKIDRYMCYFEECAQSLENKWLSNGEEDHIPLSEDCFVYAVHCAVLSILGDFYKEEKTFKQFKDNYTVVWDSMEYSLANPSAAQDDERTKRFDTALNFLKSSLKAAVSYRKEKELHFQNDLMIDVLISNCPDEETLLSEAMVYLVGSFHTTGNLITWAMYFLATHKDVQDKLYMEIKSVIGERGNVDKDNFSEFVYLLQVIDETMRCSVLAPWGARFQDIESELGGHRIPKNTPVIHALGVLLQDEKRWPLPNKFDPDRFSPENRKKLPNNSFVPFGFAGKRKCPGYRFAYWDAGVFLATVIRRFEVKMCEDQVVTPVYGIVAHPQDEIWVKVTKRQ